MKIQCANCKGYKTVTDRATTAAVGFGLVFFGGLFSVFLFPLIFVVIGILILFGAAFTKSKRVMCKTCGYSAPL